MTEKIRGRGHRGQGQYQRQNNKRQAQSKKRRERASEMLRNAKNRYFVILQKKNAITHIHTYARPHTERKHRSTKQTKEQSKHPNSNPIQ